MKRAALVAGGLVVTGVLVVGAAVVVSDQLTRTPKIEGCTAKVAGTADASLDLEQAENAALISAVAVRRGLPPRAATIALTAAYQESDLRNIQYGDRDSLGLFQQRPSQGWGTPEQILDPYYAVSTFYAHLSKVHGYAGMPISEAVQKVQRSADGGAYAKHELNARALASSLTGQSAAAFSCSFDTSGDGSQATGSGLDGRLRGELSKAFGSSVVRSAAGVGFSGGGTNGGSKGGSAAGAADGSTSGKPAQPVRLTVPDRDRGWAVAQWAVANAHRLGISVVAYDGRRWSAESDGGWAKDTSASASSVLVAPRSA